MSLKALFASFVLILFAALAAGPVMASAKPKKSKAPITRQAPKPVVAPAPAPKDGVAEARLIEIYQLIGKGETKAALSHAERLVNDFPTFALAQLVYGDLLSARARPVQSFGDVPDAQRVVGETALADLRAESQLRLKALRERPPPGAIPSEFLMLSQRSKHAIAVDASRARLYLFENRPSGLILVADYYISVGKLGVEKKIEGDLRTPLGVYFITSQLDPKTLKDYYGTGALPINYPNVLDLKRGKSGSGIWLHGTPPTQFSRPPLASDGCVVIANPDLDRIIRTVAIRSTPVVISQQLKWVDPHSVQTQVKQFETRLGEFVVEVYPDKAPKTVENFPAIRQGQALRRHDLSPRHRTTSWCRAAASTPTMSRKRPARRSCTKAARPWPKAARATWSAPWPWPAPVTRIPPARSSSSMSRTTRFLDPTLIPPGRSGAEIRVPGPRIRKYAPRANLVNAPAAVWLHRVRQGRQWHGRRHRR
jgi:hypothetical protein